MLLKIIYLCVGLISVGTGSAGIFLPVLPTIPLYLLAAFCFTKSSEPFSKWFTGTKLYKKHIEGYAKNQAMTLKSKLAILISVTVMLLMAYIFINVLAMRIMIAFLLLLKYLYFFIKIKTIRVDKPNYKQKIINRERVMKKIILLALGFILIFALTACGGDNSLSDNPPAFIADNTNNSELSDSGEAAETKTESHILIAYFTNPEPDGVDAVAGASRVVVNGEIFGNTQFIARIIQHETKGELFRIDTTHTYPSRGDGLMELADQELKNNIRPELTERIENIDKYEVVFLGFPNWWADMPAALYTFLEEYDLSGKTLIPFCPHGGSGFSGTLRTIANLQPNATVSDKSFTISRDSVANGENDVIAWLRDLGYAE
jgi:uncharacterized membrane protein YbaN (DUF454 family)/flavodoxin